MSDGLESWINPPTKPSAPAPIAQAKPFPEELPPVPERSYELRIQGMSCQAAIDYCTRNLVTHPQEKLWICKETGKETYSIYRERS